MTTQKIQISAIRHFEKIQVERDLIFKYHTADCWTLYLIDSGSVDFYYGTSGRILRKNDFTVVEPYSELSSVSMSHMSARMIRLDIESPDNSLLFFTKKSFNSGELNPLLEKAISEIDAADMVYDGHLQSFGNAYMADTLARNIIEQFLIESKRKYYTERQFSAYYVIPKFKNEWECQNANHRFYKDLLNNRALYSIYNEHTEKENAGTHHIEEIKKYLKDNVYSNLSLDDLVDHFHFSKTYICRIFKNAVSETVIEYYTQLKMKEAQRLIGEQKYNFTQIAMMLKFSSVNYFSLTFKRYFGFSPSEYAAKTRTVINK